MSHESDEAKLRQSIRDELTARAPTAGYLDAFAIALTYNAFVPEFTHDRIREIVREEAGRLGMAVVDNS